MQRVLIFSLTYHPFVGGAEVAIKEITDRCHSDQYSFDLITLRFDRALPRVETIGNVTVHRIGWSVVGAKISDRSMPLRCKIAKVLFPITAWWKAMWLHRGHRFDIAWAMMANQAGFAALFFTWMYPHVRFFLELQDGRDFVAMKSRRPVLRILWPLYKKIYTSADMIKVIGTFLALQVREIGYAGTLEIIPNGVDFKRFSEPVAAMRLNDLKARFDKKPGDVFLFTASRLVLSRGVEDAIEALVHLPPNVKFLIAGDGEDREKLEHIAHGLGVADRVMFAGHVAPAAIPAYLQISDIFVRPSIIEAFGNAFVEAFAAGIPVIATPVGGIPDFLFDPIRNPDKKPTGLFCEVRNPESIARALLRYLNDPALKAQIIENARSLAADKYDWDLIAHEVRAKIFAAL
jgi:glycosyltransferase involved in cell wall biosynthesis